MQDLTLMSDFVGNEKDFFSFDAEKLEPKSDVEEDAGDLVGKKRPAPELKPE
jgi:hypothetical protein